MTVLRLSLLCGILAVAATSAFFYRQRRQDTREAAGLRAENARMRLETTVRVRRAPAHDRSALSAPGRTPPAASPAATARPAEYYRDEGNPTPLAALQTLAWACDRGDTDRVGRLLHLDSAARPKLEALRAAMPADARARWKSVDEMAAQLLTHHFMARPFPNADVLATATLEQIAEDRVRLRLPNVPKDGTEYQRTVDGWKFAVTEAMVDNYARRMHSSGPGG